MRTLSPFVVAAGLLALSLPEVHAGTQFGIGAGTYTGSEFDEEWGYGVNAELGMLFSDQPVNFFLGVQANYIDGLSTSEKLGVLDASEADMDLFEGAMVARLLFPLGNDHIKLYGEGSLGTANVSISGQTKARTRIGGREFSFNSQFDENNWVFAWSLGGGVQFDLTQSIGLRIGYSYHGLGDSEIFGLNAETGSVQGASASLVFKF